MPKSITILGASGLIGFEVLKLALKNYEIEHVTILVRKSLQLNHPKLTEIITDFKNLSDLDDLTVGDALICCLGTTRKKTPNLQDYKKIDFGLTIHFAQLAKKQNVQQVHLISAIGADINSKIFYNRLKGETEEELINVNFPQTIIYRPSLLIGKRNEFRFGELIAQKIAPVLDIFLMGSMKKYHSISAHEIAKAVIHKILSEGKKLEILEYNDFQKINQ
jgi:uncharacterized protein YbjT (DUF2867 family)